MQPIPIITKKYQRGNQIRKSKKDIQHNDQKENKKDKTCEFESRSWRGVQLYVIKFVGDLRQAGFSWILRFPPTIIKLTTAI